MELWQGFYQATAHFDLEIEASDSNRAIVDMIPKSCKSPMQKKQVFIEIN